MGGGTLSRSRRRTSEGMLRHRRVRGKGGEREGHASRVRGGGHENLSWGSATQGLNVKTDNRVVSRS